MNAPRSLLFILALAAVPVSAWCQASPSPAASPEPEPVAQRVLHFRPLTPEERSALEAAGERARRDPGVQAAAVRLRHAAQEYDDAMVAKDDAIEPILEKIRSADGPGASPHLTLTADEREELQIDREGMQGSPEANELEAAQTNYRNVEIHVLTAANPSLAAIIARLPSGRRGLGFRRLLAPGPLTGGTSR